MSDQARPKLFSRLSSYFNPRALGYGADTSEPPGERAALRVNPTPPLPTIDFSSSDQIDSRPPSSPTADISTQRPIVSRAVTTIAVEDPDTIQDTTLTRPPLKRSATTTAAFIQTHSSSPDILDTMDRGNPGLLRRATQAISQGLELGDGSSYAHRNAPRAPSNWDPHTHHRFVVRVWDAVNEAAAKNSKYPKSTTALLVATQQTAISKLPELAEGDVTLTRDWIEYVLGIALRHPFCTDEKMGRWEVLASSGGARATWGPW